MSNQQVKGLCHGIEKGRGLRFSPSKLSRYIKLCLAQHTHDKRLPAGQLHTRIIYP